MMCGGLSAVKDADDKINGICLEIKGSLQEKLGCGDIIKVVKYRTQVVAGVNYFVKIEVGAAKYVHARIYEPLPHDEKGPELHSFEENKKEEDEILYF